MNIILHDLTQLEYKSLESALKNEGIAVQLLDESDQAAPAEYHSGLSEYVHVGLTLTQIGLTAFSLWLRNRKRPARQKITIVTKKGRKVDTTLDKLKKLNSESVGDMKDIIDKLKDLL